MIIPSSLVTGVWTIIDISRSIESSPLLPWLPSTPLPLWSAFWALLPPMFFFLEYQAMWNCCQGKDSDFERLKHSQHLAGAVWLAIVAIIGGASVREWLKEGQDNEIQKLERRIENLESRPTWTPRF